MHAYVTVGGDSTDKRKDEGKQPTKKTAGEEEGGEAEELVIIPTTFKAREETKFTLRPSPTSRSSCESTLGPSRQAPSSAPAIERGAQGRPPILWFVGCKTNEEEERCTLQM